VHTNYNPRIQEAYMKQNTVVGKTGYKCLFIYLFVVYLTTLFQSLDHLASSERVILNNELEMIWKEAIVA
jgi:hypothetical protein